MDVKFDSSDLNRLTARLEELEEGIEERLLNVCTDMAMKMRTNAAQLVYGPYPYLTYVTGETGDSIDPYVVKTENGIDFGITTNNLRTIYHELGTGPVGTEAGYPGENDVDEPIVRRSTGWTYWDPNMARKNTDINPGKEGQWEFSDMQSYFDFKQGGFVTTEGVPPKAFMYQATEDMLILAADEIQKVIGDIMNGS